MHANKYFYPLSLNKYHSSSIRLKSSILLFACCHFLAGCTPPVTHSLDIASLHAPADFPEAYYQQAKKQGAKILVVDSRNSLITINVSRGGPLARLGHDHVIASHDVKGYVDNTANRADLYIPLEKLVVDEADLRSKAGFKTQPSMDAIDGTRNNMQQKVLENALYPFALISVNRTESNPGSFAVLIKLHGTRKTFDVPLKIENVDGKMLITGQLNLKQSDFGITPFSVLGGALQVQDDLEIHFNITASAI